MSADGRLVLFESDATNLGPPAPRAGSHVYVRDMVSGVTIPVSNFPDGSLPVVSTTAPAISADGRVIALHTYTPFVPNMPPRPSPELVLRLLPA